MLTDKNILITGASRGIGRAIAFEAAKHGARVGINYFKSPAEAQSLAVEISEAGFAKPLLLPFDATHLEEIQNAVEHFCQVCGPLHGLVNNAAINIPGLLPVLSEAEIRAQLDSALLGPIFCAQTVIPYMMRRKQGTIVNIGSIVCGKPSRGQSVYAAAKGGLLAFTRALAVEYGRKGIRVNCIQPGPTETDMLQITQNLVGDDILKQIPLGQYTSPQSIAILTVLLLSNQSASITGACIDCDGGYSLT